MSIMKYCLREIGGKKYFTGIDVESILAKTKDAIENALTDISSKARYAAWDGARKEIREMDFDALWNQWAYKRQSKYHHFWIEMTPVACGAINSIGNAKPFTIDATCYSYDDKDTVKARVLSVLEDAFTESEIFYYKAKCAV